MATFTANLSRVRNGAASGGTMPVTPSVPDATATAITTSGTSQQANITSSGVHQVWTLTVAGGAVWVLFGTDPTAVAGSGWYIAADTTRDFSVTVASEKVAVIDA